jgi:hypothetical protein
MSFIIIGMFFGKWYQELNYNRPQLFKSMLYIGILFTLSGAPLVFIYGDYNYNGFYHMGPGGVLYFAGWTLIFLWIIYKISVNIRENKFVRLLKYCSKNLTSMYMTQWILISWGKGIFGFRENGITTVLALIVMYIALTFSVQILLDLLKKKSQKSKPVEVLN